MKTTQALLATLIAALFAAQPALAAPMDLADGDRVKLDRVGTYGGIGGGGEFRTVGVNVAAGLGDSFETFCLERTESITLGTPYYVDINTEAKAGGYGGAVAGADPLSYSSAWLYTQYRNDALDDLFGGFSYTSNASLNSLQLAFWKLEDELDPSWLATYGADAMAVSLVSVASASGWTSLGDVRVMNLYSSYSPTGGFSGPKQSQLYMMPIPEPETYALLMAGLGLMGFVARRRKQQLTNT